MPVEIRMLCGHRFAVSEADSTKDMRCPFCKDKPALASLSSRDEALEAEWYRWLNRQDNFILCVEHPGGAKTYRLKCGVALDRWIAARIAEERALRSPAEQNAVPQEKRIAAWVDGVCKTCGNETHSCRCEHPGRGLAERLLFGDPPGTVRTDSTAPDRSPTHTPTEDCGFDRNGSHSAGHYVCMCGWEDSTDQAIHDAPDRTSGGAMPEDALQRLWCEAIIATQDGASGRMVCDVERLLHYVNARKGALRRPAPPAAGWKPIETAPKDGTFVLAWCVHANAKYAKDAQGEGWCGPVVTHWTDHNGGGWTWHGLAGNFTHWMPLPASPEAGGRG